jgi:hypothetical protein
MVPDAPYPPIMPFTAHTTDGSLGPVTLAVNCWVLERPTFAQFGVIAIEIGAVGGMKAATADPDLVVSAWLVAVIMTDEAVGSDEGAV